MGVFVGFLALFLHHCFTHTISFKFDLKAIQSSPKQSRAMTVTDKISASKSTCENTPLLPNNIPDDIESDNRETTDPDRSKQENVGDWFRSARQWALNNLVLIAITLLLLGGIIALSVYFAGMSEALPTVPSRLSISQS